MFTLINITKGKGEMLVVGRTIFPRPTSWKIAFISTLSWWKGEAIFAYVYVPPQYNLEDYVIEREENKVILRQGNSPVLEMEIIPMSPYLWVMYQVESFLFGPFLSFGKWRWEDKWEKKVTRIVEEED